MGPNLIGLLPSKRQKRSLSVSLLPLLSATMCEDMWLQGSCLQARKRALPQTNHTSTLLSGVQLLEQWENTYLLFKPHGLFVCLKSEMTNTNGYCCGKGRGGQHCDAWNFLNRVSGNQWSRRPHIYVDRQWEQENIVKEERAIKTYEFGEQRGGNICEFYCGTQNGTCLLRIKNKE